MATSNAPSTFGLLCFARGGQPPSTLVAAHPASTAALPELHLNIWERDPDRHSKNPDSFLDVGLMLNLGEHADSIELVLPQKMPVASIVDLSPTIAQAQAIPAIFNESWAIAHVGSQGSDSVVYDPANVGRSFAVVSITGAITETRHAGHDALSISVSELVARANAVAHLTGRNIERVYVRFRLLEFKKQYYCVGAGERANDWWQPSWQRTEDIDFRLNVRRGAPPRLESQIGRFLEFSKVHLFLMRSRDKDIVFQDKLFKASRSLEDEDFWAQYSIYGTPLSREASLKRVQNSLGYHWKAAGSEPVKEFGTLARFKIVEFGVGKFVAVAMIVGAMGSMLWDGTKGLYGWATSHGGERATMTSSVEVGTAGRAANPQPTASGVKLPAEKKEGG
ncbi:hypothetical protein [Burkholderia vietnamiensis]|uniref:hypothetical protein n=1 Tax=Burkholderia vietnamiensis TaxID=60552 RepID=UPI001593A887|nr:hypothetical protein [Burkholderia vietnamiensis]MCA7946347.1 hypothetical protein [Burkholderia vietnamiensis]HDR8971457.1 hypothetical protein [Burkholderia vietnamiensis]HDR9144772.1 hypothetical protein [Burkholderia vietnamiensis]HDR9218569.1 hypothetical protein [Burkholderia vietnamiensis]